MYRTLFKFAVLTITILLVNLVTSYITDYLVTFRHDYKPLSFTLIAMGIIVLIFYPLFRWMEGWLNTFTLRVLKKGKSMGGKYLGLIFIFSICLFFLCYFYMKYWYHQDLIRLLFQGKLF